MRGSSRTRRWKKCNNCGNERKIVHKNHVVYKNGIRSYCGTYRIMRVKKMRMTMSIKQAKEIVENLSVVVDEIRFEFTPQSISFRAVDLSHVCLLCAEYDVRKFSEYDVEESILALDLRTLRELFKGHKVTDDISFEWEDDKPDIKITIGLLTKTIRKIEGTHPPNYPEIDYPCRSSLTAEWFENAMKHASDVTDIITLECDDDGFSVSAESGEDNISISCPEGASSDESSEQTYSANYLKKMARRIRMTSGKETHIALDFGTGIPLRILFSSELTGGQYDYLLAPRVLGDV